MLDYLLLTQQRQNQGHFSILQGNHFLKFQLACKYNHIEQHCTLPEYNEFKKKKCS